MNSNEVFVNRRFDKRIHWHLVVALCAGATVTCGCGPVPSQSPLDAQVLGGRARVCSARHRIPTAHSCAWRCASGRDGEEVLLAGGSPGEGGLSLFRASLTMTSIPTTQTDHLLFRPVDIQLETKFLC